MSPSNQSDQNEVVAVILAKMVAEADRDGLLIRFVDLPREDIALLSHRWGNKYKVAPTEDSEVVEGDPLAPPYSDQHESHLRLKGTSKEGIRLKVVLGHISGDRGEAEGWYTDRYSSASYLYTLVRRPTGWRITDAKHEFSADRFSGKSSSLHIKPP